MYEDAHLEMSYEDRFVVFDDFDPFESALFNELNEDDGYDGPDDDFDVPDNFADYGDEDNIFGKGV